jgi:hypothetical protein
MAFGVRADANGGSGNGVRHPFEVTLKSIEIKYEGGSIDFF